MFKEIATQTVPVDTESSTNVSDVVTVDNTHSNEAVDHTSSDDVICGKDVQLEHVVGSEVSASTNHRDVQSRKSEVMPLIPTVSISSNKREDKLTLPPLAIGKLYVPINDFIQPSQADVITTHRACRKYIGPQYPPAVSNNFITGFFYPKLSHATFGYDVLLKQNKLVEDNLQLPILVSKPLPFYNRKGEKIRNLRAIDISTGRSKFKPVSKLKKIECGVQSNFVIPLSREEPPSATSSKQSSHSRCSPEKSNFFKTQPPDMISENEDDSFYDDQAAGRYKIERWKLEKRTRPITNNFRRSRTTLDFDTVSSAFRTLHLPRNFSNDVMSSKVKFVDLDII